MPDLLDRLTGHPTRPVDRRSAAPPCARRNPLLERRRPCAAEGCVASTQFKKPFCTEHVLDLPLPRALHEVWYAERTKILERDVLVSLSVHGARTARRLDKDADVYDLMRTEKALARLEARGLLVKEFVGSRRGTPRSVVQITDAGRRVLEVPLVVAFEPLQEEPDEDENEGEERTARGRKATSLEEDLRPFARRLGAWVLADPIPDPKLEKIDCSCGRRARLQEITRCPCRTAGAPEPNEPENQEKTEEESMPAKPTFETCPKCKEAPARGTHVKFCKGPPGASASEKAPPKPKAAPPVPYSLRADAARAKRVAAMVEAMVTKASKSPGATKAKARTNGTHAAPAAPPTPDREQLVNGTISFIVRCGSPEVAREVFAEAERRLAAFRGLPGGDA